MYYRIQHKYVKYTIPQCAVEFNINMLNTQYQCATKFNINMLNTQYQCATEFNINMLNTQSHNVLQNST